jgi:Ulp1 family protease
MGEKINSGTVEKVFGLVHMPNHWGAFQVDLQRKKILFGDSLSMSPPKEDLDAVRKWLQRNGVDTKRWDPKVGLFKVSQQPAGSGSCAVAAVNAIEHSIDNAVECWTHERSAFHRTRFLKFLTGYSKVILILRYQRYITRHQSNLIR